MLHPGEDWNKNSGGNSDCEETIHVIGDGVVEAVPSDCSWGTLIVRHEGVPGYGTLWSVYGHLDSAVVSEAQEVSRGDVVGIVARKGTDYCHLHLEIRRDRDGNGVLDEAPCFFPTNAGSGNDPTWVNDRYLDPSDFIDANAPGSGPALVITSPDGGEDWEAGTTQTITWTSESVTGNVQIQPYLNGVPQTNLAASAPNTGELVWSIPYDYQTGSGYLISISAMEGAVYDFSNSKFTILAGECAVDEAPCDDGDACTVGDSCSGGVCEAGSALNCGDGKLCTDDSCDSASGCVNTNNTLPCDDGDACTVGDSCSGGACRAGSALNCGDGKLCTDDSCEPATGCVNTNNTLPCDDGETCTTNDRCDAGACGGDIVPGCDPCGDGQIDEGEECDDGDREYRYGEFCRADCRAVPCGRSMDTSTVNPSASEALFVLLAAVGRETCDPRICDVTGGGDGVFTTDA